jgi:flavin reductase (DIM6/NTAB) family NADH-FMN oxidoreductase RutF
MPKIPVDQYAYIYPMPMVVVGATVKDRPTFLAVAWVTRVNYKPPLVAVALGKSHYTNQGIHASRAFSVNIPSVDLVQKVDYVGIVSGHKEDKSGLFRVVPGNATGAPMIDDCPLCMECKLVQVVDLPADELFIGEIVGAYADADCCSDGVPDVEKMRPFTLTMPDNRYWEVGRSVGKAWSIGNSLKR